MTLSWYWLRGTAAVVLVGLLAHRQDFRSPLDSSMISARTRWAARSTRERGNRDLGIEIRGAVGAGLGYQLMKSQRQELAVLAMPLLVREVPLEEPATTQGLALAATRYSLFLNEYPKANLDLTNQLRFGLSEPGRFQLYLNVSVRRELWRDFFIGGSAYDSYDNRPPASSTLKNDVGVGLTFGWSF